MNQKEYQLIGGAIHRSGMANSLNKNKVKRDAAEKMRQLIISDLTATLAHEYPNFDKAKFEETCGK